MMKNANNGIDYPPLHYWHLLFIFRIDSLNIIFLYQVNFGSVAQISHHHLPPCLRLHSWH